MITNFSEESEQIIIQAKKTSICMLKPVIKEELVFSAFLKLQHPLWLIIKNKYGLEDIPLENFISNDLLRNSTDDSDKPENRKKEDEFFAVANNEAKKNGSYLIEPYHLFKSVFLMKSNCIIDYFKDKGISPKAVLEVLNKVSYADLADTIAKEKKYKSILPTRQFSRRTEQLQTVSDSGFDLENYGRNLNFLAKNGKLDQVYFRDEEIKSTIEILCRRQQNNPLLIGEAGVGKTAIVEGIAQFIVSGKAPDVMKEKEIFELSLTSLVAGTIYRGQFEENIKKVIDACSNNPNLILFIDEIHMIIGAGGEKGVSDAANILKPALARGQLRCIGATTTKESRQFLEKDKALKRRFQPVFVSEPTPQQTIAMLNKCKDKFEKFHGVKISDDAIKASVELASAHIKDRFFPGKAIDLIDHACARRKINPGAGNNTIMAEDVSEIVAKYAQVPIIQLLAGKTTDLALLEERLKERVIGQGTAVKELVEVIHLAKMGMDISPDRPEGVIMLVGPTGVGKTELAKSLTLALLGDETRLINFDMTEYKDETSVNRLIGSAPGYVGFEQESKLISAVRSNPNSIILMDEIEKAHPSVLNILKQVFQKGTLTAQDGETVFFSHVTFILTSNIGAEVLKEEDLNRLEYKELCASVKMTLQEEVGNRFSASFLNALDKVIYFDPIDRDCMKKIFCKQIDTVIKRMELKGIEIELNSGVVDFLLDKGTSIRFGAKFVNKAIEDHILKPIVKIILSCEKKHINISLSKDRNLVFTSD